MAWVHGDLNGANVILDPQGNVWLIDFFHTGPGHVLKDLLKLENDLFYIFTPLEDEAALAQALALTDGLCEVDDWPRRCRRPRRWGSPTPAWCGPGKRRASCAASIRSCSARAAVPCRRSTPSCATRCTRSPSTSRTSAKSAGRSIRRGALRPASPTSCGRRCRCGSTGSKTAARAGGDHRFLRDVAIAGGTRRPTSPGCSPMGSPTSSVCFRRRARRLRRSQSAGALPYGRSGRAAAPIADQSVPTLAEARSVVAWLRTRLGAGGRIVVHCAAGLGRSGAIVACLLCALGASAEGPSRACAPRAGCGNRDRGTGGVRAAVRTIGPSDCPGRHVVRRRGRGSPRPRWSTKRPAR